MALGQCQTPATNSQPYADTSVSQDKTTPSVLRKTWEQPAFEGLIRNAIRYAIERCEVVGLSALPAGSYIFTVTASSRLYFTENGAHVSDMSCFTTLDGPGTNLRDTLAVAEHHTESLTLALTVPEGSKFTLRCSEDVTQGDDATLAVAWVLAQKVTAINP